MPYKELETFPTIYLLYTTKTTGGIQKAYNNVCYESYSTKQN